MPFRSLLGRIRSPAARDSSNVPKLRENEVASSVSNAVPSEVSTEGKYDIKVLHTPMETADIAVDIVFIHGLTGDRENTWKRDGVLWPRDLLPKRLPQARIMTFGYDANVVSFLSAVSQNRIASHAQNLLSSLADARDETDTSEVPILFVAHSLGGLVCKDALISSESSAESHMRKIFDCTQGIAFLGTPHAGSADARFAEVVGNFTNIVRRTNTGILRVLQPNSEVLARISTAFHTLLRRRVEEGHRPMSIMCYTEELPVAGIGLIVPEHSAILVDRPHRSIHANHMDMAKFESVNNPGYRAVSTMLWRWSQGVKDAPKKVVVEPVATDNPAQQDLRDSNGRTALHAAVTSGEIKDVVSLLDSGVSPNTRDNEDSTPLHAAVLRGDRKAVSFLLDHGAKIDATDNELRTPLFLASLCGHAKIVEKLLEEGASMDKKDDSGKTAEEIAAENGHKIIVQQFEQYRRSQLTPAQKTALDEKLFIAARHGSLEGVRTCLHQGADVNKFHDFSTALHCAAERRHEDMVRLLLEKGADVSIKNSRQRTPLDCAASAGDEKLVKLLFKKDVSSSSAIIRASADAEFHRNRQHRAIVEFLLDEEICTDYDKERALQLAADMGSLEIVKLLLERGVDIQTKQLSLCPLLCAAQNGHFSVVTLLLEKGADIEAKNSSDQTALILAANASDDRELVALMKILLEYGADVRAADADGNTALHMAACKGRFAAVNLLRRSGADLKATNFQSKTPLDEARQFGKYQVVSLLEAALKINISGDGTQDLTALQKAAHKDEVQVVEILLEMGVDVDVKHEGDTALTFAAKNGCAEVIKLLLDAGAQASFGDRQGQTALHLAAFYGHCNAVAVLVKGGSDIESTDKEGATPLISALSRGYNNELTTSIVQFLLEEGANPKAVDRYGRTPLALAEKWEMDEAVSILKQRLEI